MSSRMTERREAIAKFVTERGTVTFAQLKKTFPDVSEMTIRTDLRPLDEARRIVRTHGGARSVEYVVGTDNLLLNRSARNVEEKNIIAGKAKELVRPNSTIFLDSGSTTTRLAKEIEDKRLLAFTNSLTCAAELSNLENVHTIVIGGKLNRYSMSLNGSKSIEEIGLLNFDMLFLGLISFQSSMGLAAAPTTRRRSSVRSYPTRSARRCSWIPQSSGSAAPSRSAASRTWTTSSPTAS